MVKGKKYIAALLTVASICSFAGIGISNPVYAAELSNYEDLNDNKYYEGKDSNNKTWQYYKNNDGSITLTGTFDLAETMYVPERVSGYKVTGLKQLGRFVSTRDEAINQAIETGGVVKKVVLPDTLEYIGGSAWYCCHNIEEADIPDSAKYYDYWCVPEKCRDKYRNSDGLGIFRNILYDGKKAKGEVVIPDNVNEIEPYAFEGNDNIKSVKIPGNIEIIGNGTFKDCTNLSKVYFEEGLKKIDYDAFLNCGQLGSVILPDSVETLGWESFGSCSSLTSVSYKDGLKVDQSFQRTPWNETKINGKEKINSTQTGTSGQVNTDKPTGTVSDWQYIDGKWYYINADGSKQKGWFFDIRYGKWYFLDENDGVRQIGWKYYAPYNSWFYLDPYDGARLSGWFYDPNYGSWFFLNDNGTMKIGWMYDYNYGQWFYLNGNGTMRTGWLYDNNDGNWYYLYSNGAMARSTYINGYYVNASGAWVY